ncbi:MAG: CoA-binding protein [Myxococcota bacterium]
MRSPHQVRAPTAVQEFLKCHRFGFVGVSRKEDAFSRTVFRAFRTSGFEPVAINIAAAEAGETIDGTPTYARLSDVEPALDSAFIIGRVDRLRAQFDEAIESGIRYVWIHGPGSGSRSIPDEILARAKRHGVVLVAGECPLMFLPRQGWIHRIHGGLRGWSMGWPRTPAAWSERLSSS